MKLILDLGNSRTKWGLFNKQGLVSHGVVSDTLELPCAWSEISTLGLCSVVGPEREAAVLQDLYKRGLDPQITVSRVVSQAMARGLSNGYHSAAQLGVDRWAAAIAVHARTPTASLIVLAGTATTIDALHEEGEFMGGLILPGIQLMIESLSTATHGIGMSSGHYVDFPKATADAVYSGAIQATIGAIRQQYEQLKGLSKTAPRIYLSGGAASLIAESLKTLELSAEIVETLILEGTAELL